MFMLYQISVVALLREIHHLLSEPSFVGKINFIFTQAEYDWFTISHRQPNEINVEVDFGEK